jgi:hypothetical protein
MSNLQISIEAPAIDPQIKRLGNYDQRWLVRTKDAMSKTVLLVEAGSKEEAPVWRGHLRRSLSSKVEAVSSVITGRVGSNLDSAYPATMENGRLPGSKMPPPSALERWVELVLGVPEAEAPGVAFVVARSIARKGIKGVFFLKRTYTEGKDRIVGFFQEAAALIMKDMRS